MYICFHPIYNLQIYSFANYLIKPTANTKFSPGYFWNCIYSCQIVNESHSLPFWVWVSISIVAVIITVIGLLLTTVSVTNKKHYASSRIKGDFSFTNDERRNSLVSNPSYSYSFNIPTACAKWA